MDEALLEEISQLKSASKQMQQKYSDHNADL